MKKIFIILIMLVYGVTSSGMTITLHYCCGKLDDISLAAKHETRCPMGGKHLKNSSCCKDKQISTKTIADQAAAKWVQTSQLSVALVTPQASFTSYLQQFATTNTLARGTPVPISTVPLFIKNCVFRI